MSEPRARYGASPWLSRLGGGRPRIRRAALLVSGAVLALTTLEAILRGGAAAQLGVPPLWLLNLLGCMPYTAGLLVPMLRPRSHRLLVLALVLGTAGFLVLPGLLAVPTTGSASLEMALLSALISISGSVRGAVALLGAGIYVVLSQPVRSRPR
ncbi:hypothetical protein [Brachybacterium hainanense]|uniref:Uncharacterized protein n=1 Tax=Brachybacterium hainanense TaxID=1541174 RepID=A0ABV6RCF5_9MICO